MNESHSPRKPAAGPVLGPAGPDAAPKDKRRLPVAVALAREPEAGGRDAAPRVLAGGRGAAAEQILEIAFARGVRVREDANLAELLSAIDVDSDIPAEAFAAVAEILIYLYRADSRFGPPDEPDEEGAAA